MRRGVIIVCIALACLGAGSVARAITADEAEIERLRLKLQELQQQEDRIRTDLLNPTIAQRQTLQREIASLLAQLKLVENRIAATNTKIDLTREEIGQVQGSIEQLRAEMTQKRATIGRMVLFLQQRDREDMVASLFKYANFSSFFRQLDDAAAVQDKLLGLIGDLKNAKATLEQQHTTLETKEGELEDLNEEARARVSQLAGVKSERDRVLKVTKGKEATYQQQLSEVEKQKAAFFKELRELELKVVSGGLFIVHVKAENVPPCKTKLFSWPEDNYYLTQGYGMTTYAKRGAYGGAPHNGIDIAAGFGSPIKTIGDGTIVANGSNSGWGNWVAVQHPNNMVSIYGHMSSFNRPAGARVSTGDVIGYEGKTGKVTGSHLHLSLYREFFTYLKGDELYFNYFEGSVNPTCYL